MENLHTTVSVKQNAEKALSSLARVPGLVEGQKCLSLIGNNVFEVFFALPFSKFINKLAKVDRRRDCVRQKIIRQGRAMKIDALVETLGALPPDAFREFGHEFFLVTAKKVSKAGCLRDYSRVLEMVITRFAYDKSYFKAFFIVGRGSDECLRTIESILGWKTPDAQLLAVKFFLVCIEKLSSSSKLRDMFHLFNFCEERLTAELSEEEKKMVLKALSIMVNSMIVKKEEKAMVEAAFNFLDSLHLTPSEIFFNKILDVLSKTFRNDRIHEKVLATMQARNVAPSLVTFNTLMDIYSLTGDFEQCLETFSKILEAGLTPDSYTFAMLIKALKNSSEINVAQAQRVLGVYEKHGLPASLVVLNSMIDIYLFMDRNEEASAVFRTVLEHDQLKPDEITFSTLIKGSCRNKNFDKAMEYFRIMRERFPALRPTRVVFNSLMDLSVKKERLPRALELFTEMQTMDISPDGFTYSILLNGLKQSEASESLIKTTLLSIKKILTISSFKLDEVFFNSVLDVCSKYQLYGLMDHFYMTMQAKHITESSITFGILIKAYGKRGQFHRAEELFSKMVRNNMRINDITYGCILDACAKSGKMEIALKIYRALAMTGLNLNSIVFTTIIKGFLKHRRSQEALDFFNSVRHHTNLSGMIITYNCALDVLVNLERIDEAIDLFQTIDKLYAADLVSYSTIIKGLCKVNRKTKALAFVRQMLESDISVDVSVVNLFLDCCANKGDFRLGIKGYQLADVHKVRPNEVTFGIMIKIYGFSRELGKAFDTLDVMKAYGIKPSIIVFTNLVHISFYSRNLKRVEQAYRLFKKEKLRGDRLLYSKLIDGFLRNRDVPRALKYLNFSHQEKVPLKPEVCDKLERAIHVKDRANLEKVADCRRFKHFRVAPMRKTNHRKEIVSNIGDRRRPGQSGKFQRRGGRGGFGQERGGNRKFGQGNGSGQGYGGYKKNSGKPKTLTLFNFRKKAENHS